MTTSQTARSMRPLVEQCWRLGSVCVKVFRCPGATRERREGRPQLSRRSSHHSRLPASSSLDVHGLIFSSTIIFCMRSWGCPDARCSSGLGDSEIERGDQEAVKARRTNPAQQTEVPISASKKAMKSYQLHEPQEGQHRPNLQFEPKHSTSANPTMAQLGLMSVALVHSFPRKPAKR